MRNRNKLKVFRFLIPIVIIFIVLFINLSLLLVAFTSTEVKDMYTTFFSIFGSVIGGLLGGYITLLGVRRTIDAQKEQEEFKLVPKKIVTLHKLLDSVKELRWKCHSEPNNISARLLAIPYDDSEIYDTEPRYTGELKDVIDEIAKFRYELINKEIEFIELTVEIDIEVYKKTRHIFQDVKKKLDMYLHEEYNLDYLIWGDFYSEQEWKDVLGGYESSFLDITSEFHDNLSQFIDYLDKEKINELINRNWS
ncbi:hypothetical protein IKS_01582 [Bacillus cereus VDM062]|nr:hypothetical protein IKS_01582 [Bacillus cereus VDM062]